MTLRRKAVHGAKWTTLQQVIGQLVDFTVFILLARLLGPDDFGLVAMAAVIIAFMGPFVSQGLGAAIVQRSELERAHLDAAFWANLFLGVALCIVLIVTSELWARFFSEPRLTAILIWLSASFVFSSLTTVQQAILRRDIKFKLLALRTLASRLAGGVVGVVLALNDFGVWSLVARQLVATFVSVLLLWRISDWRPAFRFSLAHFHDLFPFGLKVMSNEMLVFVSRRSDNLLIGYFLGPAALGYYNVAYRFMSIVFRLVSNAVSQVGMPAFARLQHEPERLRTAFYDVTQMIALIAIPAFLGIMVLVPQIVTTVLGDKWLPSIPVLQVLVLIGIVHSLLAPMVSALVGVGRPGTRLKLQVIDAVANLTGFLIVVHWGIVAVATSYVVVGYTLVPLWYLTIRRFITIRTPEYLKTIGGPLLAALIMALAIEGLVRTLTGVVTDLVILLLAVVVGVSIYSLIIYIVFPKAAAKLIDTIKILLSRTHAK